MKQIIISAAVLAGVIGFSGNAKACGEDFLETQARRAVSEDAAVADKAIARLRAAGPAGLAAMFEVHADALKQKPSPKLCAAFDAVAQQKDSVASRLYWYTDFEQAKAAARASGKPILSLRLLGKLNEEVSCANSRFFRTVLYANAEVSNVLREHFILHWKSVRPVPKITIDFGDGRMIERTITGNSIHYILDAEGRPIDALPGLYGPKAFLRGLEQAEGMAKASLQWTDQNRPTLLQRYHALSQGQIGQAWMRDLRKVGVSESTLKVASNRAREGVAKNRPTALEAAPIAVSKSGVEMPVVRALTHSLVSVTDDDTWAKIATLHVEESRLDAGSIGLMCAKSTTAGTSKLTVSKADVEGPLAPMVTNFERSIAEDTVRNEYQLHSRIHDWFAAGAVTGDVDALNERVYAELFLTPSSDPWLGLAPANVYTGLENGGLRTER